MTLQNQSNRPLPPSLSSCLSRQSCGLRSHQPSKDCPVRGEVVPDPRVRRARAGGAGVRGGGGRELPGRAAGVLQEGLGIRKPGHHQG